MYFTELIEISEHIEISLITVFFYAIDIPLITFPIFHLFNLCCLYTEIAIISNDTQIYEFQSATFVFRNVRQHILHICNVHRKSHRN